MKNRYVVVAMIHNFGNEDVAGDPDLWHSFITLEEAEACQIGIGLVNNGGGTYSRIWDRLKDELIDDYAKDDYDEDEQKHSLKTLNDLKVIKARVK